MLPWALRALRMEAGLQRGHAGRRVWRMDLAHRCTQCHSQVVGGQSQCRVNPWHPRLPLDRCPQSRGPWEQMQQMAGPSRSIAKNTPKKDQRWKLHIWSSLLILHQEYTLQYTFFGFRFGHKPLQLLFPAWDCWEYRASWKMSNGNSTINKFNKVEGAWTP